MMRQQGFFGAAMLPVSQLECTGIIEIFSAPGSRFRNVMQKSRCAWSSTSCQCALPGRGNP